MKKMILASLLLCSMILLSACGQTFSIDLKIKNIKQNVPKGASITNIEKVHLSDSSFPDLLVILDSEQFTTIEVHHYNKKTKKWSIPYKEDNHPNYGGLESLSLLDIFKDKETGLEHAFVGYRGGNAGYLSFYILGKDNSGKVKQVENKMMNEYRNSYVGKTESGFDIYSDESIVESYVWNGDSYELLKKQSVTKN